MHWRDTFINNNNARHVTIINQPIGNNNNEISMYKVGMKVGMKANLVGSMWLSLYIWILDRWSDIIKCWKTDFITKHFCV